MDNRNLLGLFILLALAGSILAGDWQSIGHDPCFRASLNTQSNNTEDLCSNLTISQDACVSNSSHQCFWNPQSRITGEFCNTCLDTCLSKQKSQNIYQLSLGGLLLALSGPLGFVVVSAITSDITSVESQVYSY